MSRILNRHLNLFNKSNVIFICIILILLLSMYLTINSMKKSEIEMQISVIEEKPISLCPEIATSSRGYFRVDFTENFPTNYQLTCKLNDILLIYILSTWKNFERREAIRRTWANKKDYQQLNQVCIIFIVGLEDKQTNLSFNGNLTNEALINNDIIQLDIHETYQNVVYKEVGALKWSNIYTSKIPFLFKTDDDLVLDSLLLADLVNLFISNRTDHSYYLQKDQEMMEAVQQTYKIDKFTLFKGKDMGGQQTMRDGKFSVHQLAWNHVRLPPYCSGFGFLFSSFIRDRLYRASLCFESEYVPGVGDLFLSGFLAGAASVRCSAWPFVNMQEIQRPCYPLFRIHSRLLVCSTSLHVGKKDYSDFDLSWESILHRHHIKMTNITTNESSTTQTNIEIDRISSLNLSNETISIKNEKLNLTDLNQDKLKEKNPLMIQSNGNIN